MTDHRNELMLGFYCAGRLMHLGQHASQELQQWHQGLTPTRLVVANSLGEIGSQQGGYPLLHNVTLVSAPWINT